MVPVYKRDQVVTYTGRASRPLYRETTRPLSMTEEFQVYPYTGGSDPTLIQGESVLPLHRETTKNSLYN